jgi:hypothetical protein
VSEKTWHDFTPQEQYEMFLNGLAGIQDDAAINGYSQEGISLLREALEDFQSEFRTRFPGAAQ